jgi:prepilin signal peptidase PulO-like enzyme (type II secretory pathway)
MFLLIFQNSLLTANFYFLFSVLYFLTAASLLIIIFVFDLKHFIIPDRVLFPLIGIALIYGLIFNLQSLNGLINIFVSAFSAGAFFLAIYLVSRGKWLGFGDVKLAFFMGLFLGFPDIIVALYSAFTIGAIIGVGLILAKRKDMKSEIPFGPFLIIGTMTAFFWGNQIINWYFNLFS